MPLFFFFLFPFLFWKEDSLLMAPIKFFISNLAPFMIEQCFLMAQFMCERNTQIWDLNIVVFLSPFFFFFSPPSLLHRLSAIDYPTMQSPSASSFITGACVFWHESTDSRTVWDLPGPPSPSPPLFPPPLFPCQDYTEYSGWNWLSSCRVCNTLMQASAQHYILEEMPFHIGGGQSFNPLLPFSPPSPFFPSFLWTGKYCTDKYGLLLCSFFPLLSSETYFSERYNRFFLWGHEFLDYFVHSQRNN